MKLGTILENDHYIVVVLLALGMGFKAVRIRKADKDILDVFLSKEVCLDNLAKNQKIAQKSFIKTLL